MPPARRQPGAPTPRARRPSGAPARPPGHDPVVVASRLWGIAGGPARGPPSDPRKSAPWADLALDAFETLVAALLDPASLEIASEASSRVGIDGRAGGDAYDQCVLELRSDAPEVYQAVTLVKGLAAALAAVEGVAAADGVAYTEKAARAFAFSLADVPPELLNLPELHPGHPLIYDSLVV